MKNLKEATTSLSIVFWILLCVNVWATEGPKTVILTGTPLFTFTNDHIVLQSDRYFYKISKQSLNGVTLKKIDSAIQNHSGITLSISTRDITHAWPANYQDTNQNSQKRESTVAQVLENDNKLNFTAQLLYSFADPFVLLQVNNDVYAIEKTLLSKTMLEYLNKHNNGDVVKVSVPKSAVQNKWSFNDQPFRQLASVNEPEDVNVNKSYLRIRGTILYSPSEPSVIVQSQNNIYHLKREAVVTRQPAALSVVGSRVELIVPRNGVEYLWSLPKNDMKGNRLQ